MKRRHVPWVLFSAMAGLAGSARSEAPPSYSPYAGKTPIPRNVYFGDTHLHTSNSFDAGFANDTVGPEEAFRFARGEEVTATNGMRIRLGRRLDFMALTDHAEYLGLTPALRRSDPGLLSTEYGRKWHDLLKSGYDGAFQAAMEAIGTVQARDEKLKNEAFKRGVWDETTTIADRYDQPGAFTAFIGFEWTSELTSRNLHRVVIFKEGAEHARQVLPFSAFDSVDPEDLWTYMESYEKATGGNVLAIPHNGNLSNGLMFAVETMSGKPFDRTYAERRMRFEPLYEATQIKGDGETHPYLSPTDEFADYERWDAANLTGSLPKTKDMLQYEYVRSALKLGLQLESQLGVNPFKFGLVSGTDAHTGLTAVEENNFWGKHSGVEPNPKRFEDVVIKSPVDPKLDWLGWKQVSGGYAAVWAVENTRAALFEAMERKETYSTTGDRMLVRVFGGWDFRADEIERPDFAEQGYARGVPMGSDLKSAPAGKVPTFLVRALRDPDGANLDRVQIVKGWLDAKGEAHEMVADVAWSDGRKPSANGKLPPVGNTVDVANATWTNTIGDAALAGFWRDPDFDPKERSFYYARVISIPKPRWTAYDAKFFEVEMPTEVPMLTTERAYTSPIWYTPGN